MIFNSRLVNLEFSYLPSMFLDLGICLLLLGYSPKFLSTFINLGKKALSRNLKLELDIDNLKFNLGINTSLFTFRVPLNLSFQFSSVLSWAFSIWYSTYLITRYNSTLFHGMWIKWCDPSCLLPSSYNLGEEHLYDLIYQV